MIPSDEMVRAAVVAACEETGESPEDCLGKVTGIRARHYAMHALTHVCGRALCGRTAAELVGCPADGRHFHRNSMSQVAGIRDGRRLAKWWNEAGYGRTIAAIEKMPRPPADPPPNLSLRRQGRKLSRQITLDETPGRIARRGTENVDKMFSTWHDPDGSMPPPATSQQKQSAAQQEPKASAAVEAPSAASSAPVVKHRPNFATAVFRHATPARTPGYERDAYRPTHGNAPLIRYGKREEDELRQAVLNTGGRLVEKPGESDG